MSFPPSPMPGRARPLILVAAGGLGLAVVLGVVAHLAPAPGMSPLSLTISDYAVSDRGWPMNLAILLLGVTSLAVPLALRAVGTAVGRTVEALLLVWCLGLVTSALVPTDPIGTPELSPTGYLHRYVSVAAFVALPLAALLAARRLAADPRWRGVVPRLRGLVVVSALGLGALYYVAFPGERVMMGLVERLLVGTELTLLAVWVGRLYRIADDVRPATARSARSTVRPSGRAAGAARPGGGDPVDEVPVAGLDRRLAVNRGPAAGRDARDAADRAVAGVRVRLAAQPDATALPGGRRGERPPPVLPAQLVG